MLTYNPFSLLNALDSLKLRSYWFETGTPTYLVQLLQNGRMSVNALFLQDFT